MTKKTMVSGVKVLALLLFVNLAVVQARQVLNNENMNGCPPNALGFAPLTGWDGTSGLCAGARPCSRNPGTTTAGGPTPGTDDCGTFWSSDPEYSAISQQLSLLPGETPGLFDFQAFWTCRSSAGGICTLSLTITEGSTVTPITISGATKVSTDPGIYSATTVTGIPINDPNAVVTIDCVSTGSAFCYLTQATLSTQGTVIGDPHMSGLDGQRFDITGKSGSSFNLISDYDLQVNCLLGVQQVGPHSFISGPVMTIIAILTPNHTILANAGGHFKNDTGFVSVDGMKVAEGEKVVTEDGISVSFQIVNAKARDLGLGSDSDDHIAATSQIEIKGSYRFTVFFVENHFNPLKPEQDSGSLYYRRYLDLSVVLLDDERAPHGILGQTHLRGEDKKRSIKDWKMEGTEDDYRLGDGVLGSDFAFNKFRV